MMKWETMIKYMNQMVTKQQGEDRISSSKEKARYIDINVTNSCKTE